MKSLNANSYKDPLIKTLIFTFLLNLLLTPVIHARTILFPNKNLDYTYQFVMQILVVILSIPWGICIRKSNINLLLTEKKRRKKYTTIISIAIAIVCAFFLFPDLIAGGYTVTTGWLLDWISYDEHVIFFAFWNQIFSLCTILSILFCLAAVFFYKPGSATSTE